MEYPKYGSIVIVDDKYNEVEGLIRTLSSKGISVTYFNGDPDHLIALNGTRIIFLDLDLKLGAQDSEEKAIISNVFANLKKIVPKNNGGYILVIWSSRDSELGEKVETIIRQMQIKSAPLVNEYPLQILRISKHDVATLKDGILEFNLESLEEKLDSLIPENSILNLLTHWENRVVDASQNVISNFAEITPAEETQKQLLALFADSSTRDGELDELTVIDPAILPMSILLSDQLSLNMNSESLVEIGKEFMNTLNDKEVLKKKKKILDIDIVSKINTFYHIDSQIYCNDAPGSVYNYGEYMTLNSCSSRNCSTKWAEGLLEKVFKKIEIPTKTFDQTFKDELNTKPINEIETNVLSLYNKMDSLVQLNKLLYEDNDVSEDLYINLSRDKDKKKILKKFYMETRQKIFFDALVQATIPIFLEFSPDCDFVQNKRKKLRLVFGLLIPYNFQNILKEEKKLTLLNISGDNIINTPIIQYNEKIYQVVFDLHTITGINEEAFKDILPMFRLRKELLVDTQQKIAAHISRPGFFNMNDYLEK